MDIADPDQLDLGLFRFRRLRKRFRPKQRQLSGVFTGKRLPGKHKLDKFAGQLAIVAATMEDLVSAPDNQLFAGHAELRVQE